MSASAFCQARAKLSDDSLRQVLHGAAAKMDDSFRSVSRWNGRRVFAVDGCKVNLQRSEELDASFGRPEGGHVPQATISCLANVMTQVPSDVVIGRYGASEREMLLGHLDIVRAGDVLILDRGYPSHEMLRILLDHGVDFVVRVPATHSFEAIHDFRERDGDDYRVILGPAADVRRGCDPVELRAVRLTHPSGEESFYLTSLRRAHVSRAQIAELYRLRWQIEELFKLEKSVYFDQRQLHARSALGVRQEIIAQAIYVAVARFLLAAAAEHVDAPYHPTMPSPSRARCSRSRSTWPGSASTILNELSTVCLDSSNASPELATSDDRDAHAHGDPSSPDLDGVPWDVVELNGIALRSPSSSSLR